MLQCKKQLVMKTLFFTLHVHVGSEILGRAPTSAIEIVQYLVPLSSNTLKTILLREEKE